MHRKTRLLIADSHQFVADACKQMLEPEFDVVDVASDGRALVKSALARKPDGAVLEVMLPQLNGIEAARQLKQKLPTLRLIFFAANPDVNLAAEAFRVGASAYLLKHAGADEFMTAIRKVMRGESYLSSMIARETIDHILRTSTIDKPCQKITAREAEILQLLAEGSSMKQVAAVLGITSGTVAFHKYKMMERLGIESNAGLLQYAMRTYLSPAHSSWPVTGSDESRFMTLQNDMDDVPASLRGPDETQRLRGPARMRRRLERVYAADIQ